MQKLYTCITTFCTLFALSTLYSCINDEPTPPAPDNNTWHKTKLYYIFSVDTNSSRSDSPDTYTPQDGDVILLNLHAAPAYATYNASNNSWDCYYTGRLESCSTTGCEVEYIGNNPMVTVVNGEPDINFDGQSPHYSADSNNAFYSINSSGDITLDTNLRPCTGRIRFQGDSDSSIEIKGSFKASNGFSIADNMWQSWRYTVYNYNSLTLGITAADNGFYSPYYYCLPYGDKGLRIKQGEKVYCWNKSLKELLSTGKSGLIQLPSINADNWVSDTYKTIEESNIYLSNSSGSDNETFTIYSNVGISIELNYEITSLYSQTLYEYPFTITVYPYTATGESLPVLDSSLSLHKDDIELNEETYFNDWVYDKDASYYKVQFWGYKLKATITDLKISTF